MPKDDALLAALEQIDADSWEELCAAVPAEAAATLGLSVRRERNVVVSRCLAADNPLGNRALGLGFALADDAWTRDLVFSLRDDFVAHGRSNFALMISPHARPRGLPAWLAEAGLVERGRWVKLVRGPAAVVPVDSALRIRKAGPDEAALFGDVAACGFGRPPIIGHWMGSTVGQPRWHHYLACADEQPVAAAAMFVDGETAWLGVGATLPEHRQLGAQSALIARRLQDGLELGVRTFVSETESFNTSCKNLMRLGFECAYERPNYGLVRMT